jgi:4-diphosphocytidyl-2-C-methyl-D-erythritol kinase
LIVTERARAKVNLALHVLGRRADGYHELDSLVAFADIGDELRLEPAPEWKLRIDGPFAAALAGENDNLVLRAARGLMEYWPDRIGPARIHLTKNLPIASGIGGGSADAAATIRGLLRLHDAEVDGRELERLALSLGADVPVCLGGQACRMKGIGEDIRVLPDFTPQACVLINPGIAVATAEVFRKLGLTPGMNHGSPIASPVDWRGWRNDLQPPACALSPKIAHVLEELKRTQGVAYAAMSGSGATCFALFDDVASARKAAAALASKHPHWWSVATTLS